MTHDYGCACAAGEIGVIPAGDGEALVLGDEPLCTAWHAATQTLVRWRYAPIGFDALAAVTAALPKASWESPATPFETGSGDLVLLAANTSGNSVTADECLSVVLPGGRAFVRAATLSGPEWQFRVVRLARTAD